MKSIHAAILIAILSIGSSIHAFAMYDECDIVYNVPFHNTHWDGFEHIIFESTMIETWAQHASLGSTPLNLISGETTADFPNRVLTHLVVSSGGGSPSPGAWDIEGRGAQWTILYENGQVQVVTSPDADECAKEVFVQ